MNTYMVLTPDQVLDWKKGLSHQHLDYLVTDQGERIGVKDLTPEMICDCKYFIAGE